jgi:hypothetical protein
MIGGIPLIKGFGGVATTGKGPFAGAGITQK